MRISILKKYSKNIFGNQKAKEYQDIFQVLDIGRKVVKSND